VTIENPSGRGASPELRATMAQSEFQAAQKSAAAAYLFCIFLGIFGAHRFYLGRTGSAIAMLLITVLTAGFGVIITGIWAFIDLFLIGGILREVNQQILADVWQRYGLAPGGMNQAVAFQGQMPMPGQMPIPDQVKITGGTPVPGQNQITGETQIPGTSSDSG
jgi:TM2 domain-containing membrane protein YozV